MSTHGHLADIENDRGSTGRSLPFGELQLADRLIEIDAAAPRSDWIEPNTALAYAERGWKVFPVKRDKTPYTQRGYKSATTDAEQIRSWWAQHPTAGIAVACDASELLVLDIDPRNGGDRTLAQLEDKHGELPHGPRSLTGGGGWHLFYTAPSFSPVGKLGNGIDVKYHGYVVLPCSLHESGSRYEWLVAPDEAALPTLADPWCELLRTRNRPTTTQARNLSYREGGRTDPGRQPQQHTHANRRRDQASGRLPRRDRSSPTDRERRPL